MVIGISLSSLAADPAPVAGKVRVKLQTSVATTVGPSVRAMNKATGVLNTDVKSLDASLKKIGGVTLRPLFPANPKYAAERAKFGIDQWYEVTFDEKVSPIEAQEVLKATAGVQRAEVVRMPRLVGSDKFIPYEPSQVKAVAAKTSGTMPFNDPRLSAQWHYHNDGSINNATPGADINLFNAWKVETGSPEIVVAIIDGGVDYTHEDLADNMFVNTAELNGQPGVDDDGNGYVDDVYGFNFCTNSPTIYPHQHGTHVAGTVAAVNNNGIGVAGVAGGNGTKGSGVRMISCQVFDSRQGSGEGDFAKALVYAAEMGATIAQCSWGWDAPGYYEQAVLDAIEYFNSMSRSSNMTGGLCIFAAGNNGATGDFYPGCLDNVLTVAAMTPAKTVASYSNYGSWVDVTAPGGLLDYGAAWGVLSTLPGNSYGWNEGTSMAAPHVSGIAALLLSHYKDINFSPSMVRQQIESSVNDLYTTNPTMVGLCGSGYVDAAKALNFDASGSAPEAVSEISLLPAQDNITVEWTIPAATYDVVDHCIIYYSTEAFTADDLSKARTVSVDTKFYTSGQKVTHELKGLAPLTKYYVAMRAVSNQGNASALSEVVSASTNAGPHMTVSTTEIDLSKGPATFTIGNEDEGLLRWSYRANTAKFSPRYYSASTPYNIKPFSGKLQGEHVKHYSVIRTDDYKADEYPKDIAYYDFIFAHIGENDKNLPNSMAQMFTVDPQEFPEGFNLTSISVDGAYGEEAYFEVYGGSSAPTPSSLLSRFTPPFFAYNYNMNLPEQIHFNPGESFWICVHFPVQEATYPLGIAEANTTASTAQNALMSNDLGKTWVRLTDALRGSSYQSVPNPTWTVRARSLSPDWSKVLVLDPTSGTVRKGETQEVKVSTDGQPLVNGNYTFNIHFDTNESSKNELTIPVNLTVSDQTPDVKFGKVVDFGSLLVGQEKTLTLEVFNAGYGNFSGSSWSAGIYSDKISSSNKNFRGPDYLQSGFPARSKTRFEITFAPEESGPQSGNIVFTDKDGREFKVMVTGVATDPAKITLTPSTVEVGDLEIGADPKEVEFTVTNDGKYPLQFVMPKYSDETIEGVSAGDVHRFGYVWTSNLGGADGFEYDGNPDLIEPTDITGQFSDNDWWTDAIDLGFKFPYYGKEYDQIYINSYGAVALNPNEGNMLYPPVYPGHNYLAGGGWMTAYGSNLVMGPQSKVEYASVDGKFVVRFQNVLAVVYDQEYTPISFRIALCSNGDVEMYYDDYSADIIFNGGRNLYCGLDDPDNTDPITVTSSEMANSEWATEDEMTPEGDRYASFTSGTAVRFVAPAPNMITAITPTSGLIAPGESVKVSATVAASDDMNAGPTVTNLIINTNDLVSPTAILPFTATVTGDRSPVFAVSTQSIDFGKVFRTSVAKRSVTVRNNGHAALNVTAYSLADGRFTLASSEPFTVEPGRAKDIVVLLPTETEGEVSDVLSITSDAGNAQVQIRGTVIGCPDATLSYETVEIVTESGVVIDKPLTVTNNGNEPLVYSITAGEHVNYMPDYTQSSGVGYSYKARVDDSNISNEWIDIETNGLGTQNGLSYYLNHDYVEVELPFEFPFYGKKYTKMYVYNSGFVSFTKRTDEKAWPEPPANFPEDNLYTNIIAPYWGLHSMDETKTAGIFHYADDNRAVVSFKEYGNSMNIGVDFQLVLNADGTFRFVYKADSNVPDANIFSAFGVAGISDESGRNAVRLPERFIAFGNAVEFSPVVELTLPAGQSAVADIKVNAQLMGGEYASAITVNTNVPGKETVEIPVALTVNGTPEAILPTETITVEHAVGEQSQDQSDPMVQMGALYSIQFDVKNTGTAPYYISNISYEGAMGEDWGWGAEPVFPLYYFGESMDWLTGEITKGWTPYQYDAGEWGEPVVVGKDPVNFALAMLYSEQAMTPGEYPVKLTFDLTGLGEETVRKEVNLVFKVNPAPLAFSEDFEGVYIKAETPDYKGVREIELSNSGEGELKVTAYIDLTGEGEEVPGGGIAPLSTTSTADMKALSEHIKAGNKICSIVPNDVSEDPGDILDAPGKDMFDYLRALYYPHSQVNNKTYNYGSGNEYSVFKTATDYTAPEGGFNISHVYTVIKLGKVVEGDYKVEIVSGSDPDNGAVLAKGVYHSDPDHSVNNSYQVLIKLDRSVYMAEGQQFNVVITYPVGEAWPGTLVAKQDKVVGQRYRCWTEGAGWFDVADLFQEQYGSLGWICTPLETVKGSSWLTLDGDGTFTVAPGESTKIKLNVNAATAPLETGNKAMLVLKMNDPNQPVVNVPVVLDRNAAPAIQTESDNILIGEGEQGKISFTVTEPENEDMTIRLDDTGKLASIASITGADAVKAEGDEDLWNVTGVTGPVTVEVKLSPDFGDKGNYNATLTAADKFGSESSASVSYLVQRTNRAPEPVEPTVIELQEGASTEVIDFNTLFNEPDGEDMTFTVEVADNKIIEAFTYSNSAIFVAKAVGETTAKVEATDESGAKAVNTMKFIVKNTSGIDDITVVSSLKIWPNPVLETLYVTTDSDASEITLAVTATNGARVIEITEANEAGKAHELDMSSLSAGAYVLSVATGDSAPTSFIIIKK